MLARTIPPVVILGLGLLFFVRLVANPSAVLYSESSDLLALHAGPTMFLARSWQETGELPLWNPYSFAGCPLIHDLQLAAFYPLSLPLYYLRERSIPVALSWLVMAHVIIAGWCMYAYARSQGMGQVAALVAAWGFMFSGKWMVHLLVAGHYMTVGLAWLPLVLLCLDKAIQRKSALFATLTGAVFALLVLGTHPQWTLYAGILTAFWSLAPALEQAGLWTGPPQPGWRRVGTALLWWLGLGLWSAIVAVALVAVQLLPTLEAARLATRGLATIEARDQFELLVSLLGLLGPALSGTTSLYDWEFRTALGVLWALAALLAPVLWRGRVRFQAGVGLLLLSFAFGGGWLLKDLPGFRLFPMHTRMTLIVTLPIAYLAGWTAQAVMEGRESLAGVRRLANRMLLGVLLFALGCYGLLKLAVVRGRIPLQPYWFSLLATVPCAFFLLACVAGSSGPGRSWKALRACGLLWAGLLLVDLWAISWPCVRVRPESELFHVPECVRFLAERRSERGRVLDRSLPGDVVLTPLSPALAIAQGIEQVRGYNPLNLLAFHEYLQLLSGRAGPPRPTRMIPNFPVANRELLDLLGVRYLLRPADPRLSAEGGMQVEADARWQKVNEDRHPRAFIFFEGMRNLPAYAIYENRGVYPRAFIVPEAMPLRERSAVLAAMKSNDFHRRVLLEGCDQCPASLAPGGSFRPATIREYLPNQVTVELDGGEPGYLVLADVWYPGWTCTVDGRPVPVLRGNALFRSVRLPAGARAAVFRFSPRSYQVGRWISTGAAGAVAVLLLALAVRRARPQGRRWLRRGSDFTIGS